MNRNHQNPGSRTRHSLLKTLAVSLLLCTGGSVSASEKEPLRDRIQDIKAEFGKAMDQEVPFAKVYAPSESLKDVPQELKERLQDLKANDKMVFNPVDLTLDGAIEYALENNLGFQNDYAGLEQSSRSLKGTRAGIFEPSMQLSARRSVSKNPAQGIIPQFSSESEGLNWTYSQVFRDSTDLDVRYNSNFSNNRFQKQNTSGVTVNFSRALIGKSNQFFSQEIRLKNAKLDEKVAYYNYLGSYQDLVLDVVESYLNTVKNYRQIDVSRSVLNSRKELLELTRVKYNLGVSTRLDVLRVEVQVAGEEEALISARNTYENSLDALLNLLNYDRHDGKISVSHKGSLDTPEINADAEVKRAMENRHDLKVAELGLDQQKNNLINTREQIKNKVLVNASMQKHATDTRWSQAHDFSDKDWTLGLSYTYPLGNRQARESHHIQKIQVANQERQIQELKNRIGLQVRNAVRNIISTRQRLTVLEKNLARAKENLKLARLSYEKGIKSSIEVLDAQDDLLNVNKSYINTILDLEIAHFRLERHTGSIDVPERIQNAALEWVTTPWN